MSFFILGVVTGFAIKAIIDIIKRKLNEKS